MSESEASPAASARAPDPTARPDPLVRGFLFADLRGYTAFVERAGDRAAADLLARYRLLVRGVVAQYAGVEIRTEGDSFYLVFPSPSAAVRAGISIVGAAAEDAVTHRDEPISVGVGIHAGESAETAEGYVGSAVNLAARICSVAGPGEVLVSDTVRTLGRTSMVVRYTSRGRRSFKGVADPIELWAVTPATEGSASTARSHGVRSRRARPGLIAMGTGIVLVAIAAIATITSRPSDLGNPSPETSIGATARSTSGAPAGSASPAPFHGGALDAGTYRTTIFDPPISFTVGSGLVGALELPNAIVVALADDPERADFVDSTVGSRLSLIRPTLGVHSCDVALPLNRRNSEGPLDLDPDVVEALPTDRDGLIAWLRADPGIDVEGVDIVELAGGEAIQMDLRIAPDCRAAESAAKPVFLLRTGIAYLIRPGERIRWYITALDGRPLILAVDGRPGRFDDLDRVARSFAQSIKRIGGG